MTVSPSLIAQLLTAGLGGYTGSAARALLEEHPEIGSEVGPGALDLWRHHFRERLSELATALSFERPELFAAGGDWVRVAYESREAPLEHFVVGLQMLQAELVERLPDGSEHALSPYFRAAHAALEGPRQAETELGGSDRRVLDFLQHTLDGEGRLAARVLLDAHSEGACIAELFERVVVPAQREVGNLWHRGEINVAEEHVATLVVHKAVTILTHEAEPDPANGRTALLVSVTGDNHGLGLFLLSELFALAGWRSVALGADVPALDLLQALDGFDADLLVLSATLVPHLLAIRTTIEAIRERSRAPSVKVLVGGRAFRHAPDLWEEVGADGWAPSLSAAVAEGERLTEGR